MGKKSPPTRFGSVPTSLSNASPLRQGGRASGPDCRDRNRGDSKFGICKLCLSDEARKNSHIIPEFIYKPLYNVEIHKFCELNLAQGKPWFTEHQKGLREHMLCGSCEQRFSNIEDPASRAFRKLTPKAWIPHQEIVVPNSSGHIVWAFMLSVLWRASVSSLPFFHNVRLGPHEERLRRLFMSEDYSESSLSRFPCLLLVRKPSGTNGEHTLEAPTLKRMNGFPVYKFIVPCMTWKFVVSRNIAEWQFRDWVPVHNGEVRAFISQVTDEALHARAEESFRNHGPRH